MIEFVQLSKKMKLEIIAELGLEGNDELKALLDEEETLLAFEKSEDLCSYLVGDMPMVQFCVVKIQGIWLIDCRY